MHLEVETDGLETAYQSTDSLVKGLMTRPRPIGHVSEWLIPRTHAYIRQSSSWVWKFPQSLQQFKEGNFYAQCSYKI